MGKSALPDAMPSRHALDGNIAMPERTDNVPEHRKKLRQGKESVRVFRAPNAERQLCDVQRELSRRQKNAALASYDPLEQYETLKRQQDFWLARKEYGWEDWMAIRLLLGKMDEYGAKVGKTTGLHRRELQKIADDIPEKVRQICSVCTVFNFTPINFPFTLFECLSETLEWSKRDLKNALEKPCERFELSLEEVQKIHDGLILALYNPKVNPEILQDVFQKFCQTMNAIYHTQFVPKIRKRRK